MGRKAPKKHKTVLVALVGGNALIKPGQKGELSEQLQNADNAMKHIAKLAKRGWKLILTYGNGPQVGNILLQQELSGKSVPEMPLYVCVAESQGQIGYMMQESLYNHLHKLGIDRPIVTLVTQVLVSRKDPAFRNPTKPIGAHYKRKPLMKRGCKYVREKEGYRRVVASPEPLRIVEEHAIRKIADDSIVVCCGGGGVPVVRGKGNRGLVGIDAVIDKDLAGQKLAELVRADVLLMLTDVDCVYVNYGKPSQRPLRRLGLSEIRKYQREGHFAPGSMEPKIEAAVRFLASAKVGRKRRAIITSFELAEKALEGRAGTVIER